MPGIIMGGVLPFGCIFIQLFFILNSIWSVLALQGSALLGGAGRKCLSLFVVVLDFIVQVSTDNASVVSHSVKTNLSFRFYRAIPLFCFAEIKR